MHSTHMKKKKRLGPHPRILEALGGAAQIDLQRVLEREELHEHRAEQRRRQPVLESVGQPGKSQKRMVSFVGRLRPLGRMISSRVAQGSPAPSRFRLRRQPRHQRVTKLGHSQQQSLSSMSQSSTGGLSPTSAR